MDYTDDQLSRDVDNPDFNRHITVKFLMKHYDMSFDEANKVYDEGYREMFGEVQANDWQSMTKDERRMHIDDEFDVGKDWTDLKPSTRFNLKNSEIKNIEAEVYKSLQD